MSKKILSISVAAYNVSNTIEQCLDSFVESQLLDLFEVLVVNDGSQDNTVEIISRYVKKYPGTIYLIDKENGGHGSTINAAIKKASGKYFKVVDGDDWVDTEAFDRFLIFLSTTDVDLVLNDYQEVYPSKKNQVDVVRQYALDKIYSFDDMDPGYYLPMHSTTIKLSKYKAVGEQISEHRFYVDTEYVAFVAMATDTIVFNSECVYQYRLGEVGQSISDEGLYKHIEDLIYVVERLSSFYTEKIEKENMSSTRKKYILSIIDTRYNMIFGCFVGFKKNNKDWMLEKFDREMLTRYPHITNSVNLYNKKCIRWNYHAMLPILRFFKKIFLLCKKQ